MGGDTPGNRAGGWRWLEWSLGLAGLALLLFAALAATHRSLAADQALEVFEATRAGAAAGTVAAAAPERRRGLEALAARVPDQALWSEKAVANWEASKDAEVAPPVGAISIPSLSLRLAVLGDVDAMSLHRSVGWIPGTARPGERGNVGIAGHRDSHFRKLKDIRLGDRIVLESLQGTRAYEVSGLTVLSPEENHVLSPDHGDRLTLVTCYPFYFVGHAPERWVVSAEPVEGGEG